jgi:hypothetical protein
MRHRHLKVSRASFQITPLSYSALCVGEDERAHNIMQDTVGIKCLIVGGGGIPSLLRVKYLPIGQGVNAMRMPPSSLILPPLFVLARTWCTRRRRLKLSRLLTCAPNAAVITREGLGITHVTRRPRKIAFSIYVQLLNYISVCLSVCLLVCDWIMGKFLLSDIIVITGILLKI